MHCLFSFFISIFWGRDFTTKSTFEKFKSSLTKLYLKDLVSALPSSSVLAAWISFPLVSFLSLPSLESELAASAAATGPLPLDVL